METTTYVHRGPLLWALKSANLTYFPDPPKDPKNGTSQNGSITALGNLVNYKGVPFFGSFRVSGLGLVASLGLPLYPKP